MKSARQNEKRNFPASPVRAGTLGNAGISAAERRRRLSNLERARKFHRICLGIERRVQRGQKLRKAVVRPVWFFKTRFYKTDPQRSAAFTKGTLLRIYYQWRACGKNPGAVALRYRGHRSKLSPEVIRQFIHTAIITSSTSFRSTHRAMPEPVGTPSAFNHALPGPVRKRIVELFALRRAALRLERKLTKFLTA